MTTELTRLSGGELATLIRTQEVTAVAAMTAYLNQAEQAQQRYQPFVELNPKALECAQAADARQQSGQALGPLHGVPFTVKDWLDVQGLTAGTSFGGSLCRESTADASAVARLQAAGGIVFAKTRAAGPADATVAPRNPHNRDHSCGASSSGEAAAIAAFASPFGLGSDSGGSIRWPAHCCGVAGLKPSQGRVPLTGHIPPIIALTDPRTVIGPMARDIADLTQLLSVIAGPDHADASCLPAPLANPDAIQVRGLKVALVEGFADAQPCTETLRVLAESAALLRTAGLQVTRAVPKHIEAAYSITLNYWARPESLSWSRWQPAAAASLSLASVEEALFQWDRFRRSMHSFMQAYDLILTPVAETSAPILRDARARDYLYTLPYSLTGQPALVVPAGVDDQGLPIGVQLVGPMFAEASVLAVGALIQQANRLTR